MRQRLQESLGETSGAVEIAVEQLDRFERGAEIPSEDILLLLISHFNLQDEEAVRLWELAGYDASNQSFGDDNEQENRPGRFAEGQGQHAHVMLLALDNRVLYVNRSDIMADDNGVTIGFSQSDPSSQASQTVSRVGMSYSQAEQLLQTLQSALLHRKYTSGPKQLPPPAKQ